MKQARSPEEYWAQVEQEIGEPIKVYVLARLPAVGESARLGIVGPGPRWGLAFLTESTLYVDRSSSPSWIQRLFQRERGGEDEERTAIPISAVTKIDIPQPKRGLARILASPEIQIDVHYHGSVTPLRMMLDRRGPTDAAFIKLLSEIARAVDLRDEE